MQSVILTEAMCKNFIFAVSVLMGVEQTISLFGSILTTGSFSQAFNGCSLGIFGVFFQLVFHPLRERARFMLMPIFGK